MTVCSRCGKENLEHYKFCLGCGGELVDASSGGLDDDPAADAAADQALDALTTAPVGRPASAAALGGLPKRPVTNDGTPAHVPAIRSQSSPQRASAPAPVQPSSTERTCPNCGNQVPLEFVFCGGCGTRLIEASKAAAAPMGSAKTLFLGQSAEPQARGKLILIRPDGADGGSYPLVDGENLIGRGVDALFETDSYLSPEHASFTLKGPSLVVRDLGSLNGVFVKMTAEEEVTDNEVFRMGQELLRFNVVQAASPLDDGTEVMGSPNPGYWGRISMIIGRNQDGSAYPLAGDSIVVGRERGDILFPEDGYVSGTHARLTHRDGRFFLADLNSSNGSFIRIRGERPLRSGTFLLMGQQLFRVQFT